jgi:hypothetical protein|tara:strand:+ start:522 stop:1547 length:1026 start_codon:yes stop_codon:yes gene_type:complete
MSEDKKELDADVIEMDVMPGAEKMEDDNLPSLDMSFADVPTPEPEETPEEEVAESEQEEVTAEVEETEEETPEEAAEEEPQEEKSALAEDVPETEEPPKQEKASKPMVPKSRLDEVLAKQKALQKQLDEARAANAAVKEKQKAPEEYDFDKKELEYQEFVLDGEAEKAAALRREIRAAERAQVAYELKEEMTQTVQQDREFNALQQAAAAMEEAYPMFSKDSDQFDEALTNEVVELRNAFIANGANVVDALGKAVRYVVADKGLDAETTSLGTAPTPVDEVAKKRAQVNKKLKAASAQPPELPGESAADHGDSAINVESMTEDEFDALPAATLARLRGDIV